MSTDVESLEDTIIDKGFLMESVGGVVESKVTSDSVRLIYSGT